MTEALVPDARPVATAADVPSAPAAPAALAPQERLFPEPVDIDLAALKADLEATLARFRADAEADPFANPALRLALEVSRRIAAGDLGFPAVEALVQHLTVEGFAARADRLGRQLGELDPEANEQRLTALFERLATGPDGRAVPFEGFQAALSRAVYGLVFTAHPTFSIRGELIALLAELAAGRDRDGRVLDEAARNERLRQAASMAHKPDDPLPLKREHALSLTAIETLQTALERVVRTALRVARHYYPDRWTELDACPITIATWVGYDLDGRSDIRWTDTLYKRLLVQNAQLKRYQSVVRGARSAAAGNEDLAHTLDLIDSRLALAINEVDEEVSVFADYDPSDETVVGRIRRIAKRMHAGEGRMLVRADDIVPQVDRAIRLAGDGEVAETLVVMRTALRTSGLGIAHTHVRINATQVHNAIRKAVNMSDEPDDPRYRQSYLTAINQLLDTVEPVSINFGSVMAERTSAKRLFMVVAKILQYTDAGVPVRFLIAETESAFTVLAALYFARLFGIDDRVEICPLFETERALQNGSKVIDQLLENPHYRAYARKIGRISIQTGYSDAGRYIGQGPASGSIERLKLRIARLFEKHGLSGIEFVAFDTHGESVGRGCHPAGFPDRLSYVAPPDLLAHLARAGVAYKQETSWQGGDGYAPFFTQAGALAILTRTLEYFFGQDLPSIAPGERDAYYVERDFVTEFLTTVKAFQVGLMEDADYGALMTAFAINFHYRSGSRATRRQHDGALDGVDLQRPDQLRAIPHNATLQQLGLLANSVGGVGEAIEREPEHFFRLYEQSPRFRQVIGIARYAAGLSDPDVLRAYVATIDPETWLLRARVDGDTRAVDEERQLAAHLERLGLHNRLKPVLRRLLRDFDPMQRAFAKLPADPAGSPGVVPQATRDTLVVLHALRLAIIHEIFRMATRIPPFSSQHNTTLDRVVEAALHLEIPGVVERLRKIFPMTPDHILNEDFGEPATYVSDETGNYARENLMLFAPMERLYELARRISTAITHRAGFLG